MKNITSENKVNFYAPYWHLEVAYGGDNTGADTIGYMLLDLKESGYNEEDFKYWKVYLKPLSDISEEDAIGVAKILSSDGVGRTHNYNFKNADGYKMYIELLSEFGSDKDNTLLFFYDDGSFDKFHPNVGDKGQHFDLRYDEAIHVYQYLQSKGYALPYLDYSVSDLVENGTIRLKTK